MTQIALHATVMLLQIQITLLALAVVAQEAFDVILFSTLFHPFPSFWGFATTQVFLAVYVSRSLCEISQIEMTTDMKPFKGFYMNE